MNTKYRHINLTALPITQLVSDLHKQLDEFLQMPYIDSDVVSMRLGKMQATLNVIGAKKHEQKEKCNENNPT